MFQFCEHVGFLLVFEGADNVGKGTIMKKVVSWLRCWIEEENTKGRLCGPNVLTGMEASKSSRAEIGMVPKENWLRQLYLFVRQRQDAQQSSSPLLMLENERGWLFQAIKESCNIVVMDRSYHSSCVYQGLAGGVSDEEILAVHGPWLFRPDLTLIMSAPPDDIIRRSATIKDVGLFGKFDKDVGFQLAVQRRYKGLLGRPDFSDCVLLENVGTVEEVVEKAKEMVRPRVESWFSSLRGDVRG